MQNCPEHTGLDGSRSGGRLDGGCNIAISLTDLRRGCFRFSDVANNFRGTNQDCGGSPTPYTPLRGILSALVPHPKKC